MNILHIDPNNTNINIDNLYSYNIHSACLIVYINYTFFYILYIVHGPPYCFVLSLVSLSLVFLSQSLMSQESGVSESGVSESDVSRV